MKPGAWFRIGLFSAYLSLLALPVLAQDPVARPSGSQPAAQGVPGNTPVGSQAEAPGQSTVYVKVLSEEGRVLTREVLINFRAEDDQPEHWTTLPAPTEVTFQGLKPGTYSLAVSATGYRTASEKVEIPRSGVAIKWITITLQRDGSKFLSSAAPSAAVLPPKARKETQQGLEALKAGKLSDAEDHLLKAAKLAPESADINYLLGALFVERKELAQAESYLTKATALDSRHVRALTMLGGVRLQQQNYAGGVTVLERAVATDPQHWMAHSLLADGYLKQGKSDSAREQAQLALQTGQGAAKAAQLPLGQALANLGRYQEAATVLESFLRDVPDTPIAQEVRKLVTDLRENAATPGATPSSASMRNRDLGISLAAEPQLTVPTWGPPSIDDVHPMMVPGVTCPEQRVLDGTAARLNELVDNISRFDALEEVVHEDQDKFGKPLARSTRRFAYFAAISRSVAGTPKIEEDRQSVSAQAGFPGGIATFGLPTLAFVFHPSMRDNFETRCEGLGEWQGEPAWLMHFRQRDDRPNYLQAYTIANQQHPVALKGRAWVAANSFQIVRVEAELVRPLPQIQLLTQHHIVDYGLVTFANKKTDLWLPKNAELYFHFRGHRYYRRHAFDNFRLFSVDATEKVKAPKMPDGAQDSGGIPSRVPPL